MKIEQITKRETLTAIDVKLDETDLSLIVGLLRRFAGKNSLFIRSPKRRAQANQMLKALTGNAIY